MTKAGLLHPVGEKRARHYRATPELAGAWSRIRAQRPRRGEDDPYARSGSTQDPLAGLAGLAG